MKHVILDLPSGSYRIECYNPRTGKADGVSNGITGGGETVITLPLYEGDIALWIVEASKSSVMNNPTSCSCSAKRCSYS